MGVGGDERLEDSRVRVMVIVIVMSMVIVVSMSMVIGSISRAVHRWGRGSMAMTSGRPGPKEDVDAGRLCCEQHGVARRCTAPRVCSPPRDQVATGHASVGAESAIRDACRVGANGRALACLESKYSARVGNDSTRISTKTQTDAPLPLALPSTAVARAPRPLCVSASLRLSSLLSPLWPCPLRLSDLVSRSSASASSSSTMAEGP
jgi:hypothetical protein